MSAPVMAGAEPFSAAGGDQGALVLHGFTGNPFSIRGVASAVAAAGLTVEAPLLPGHGTSVADMVETRWSDWSAAAESAYLDLAARCEKVAVLGLSMGGTLACWLGERYLEVAGLVLINPLVRSIPADQVAAVRAMVDAGETVMDGIGSDIAQPDAAELSYDQTPIEPLLSLLDAADDVGARLADIACSVLLLSSRDDHVVPPANGDDIASALGDRCERVWLERSFHVATLDYDGDEIEKRAADFVSRVTGIDG
ncbi:MAG TPA: alpha/beta fold hydrolase [Acidimicrobiales bacterium]|nr:alpha/beta fold hydrolase [Acidimicrobiales bacterium]